MVMTVLKVFFKKKEPSVIQYCNYKNFSNDRFRIDLLIELIRSKIESSRLDIFVNTKGGSRAAATSKTECFVIIINRWKCSQSAPSWMLQQS